MFTQEHYDIFTVPGFDPRMERIKGEITPRLKELGGILSPKLEEKSGLRMTSQVAQHLRRSVNPAEETWVAFCREARGYKPYVHLRLAINQFGVKFACYLEEDADDKPAFAKNLKSNAKALGEHLSQHPQIRSHHSEANYGMMNPGLILDRKALIALAARLDSVKSQHANFAISVPRSDSTIKTTDALVQAALKSFDLLLPLYRLGIAKSVRLEL
jgi:uncharacterized protein YktB (UPF0637 family)